MTRMKFLLFVVGLVYNPAFAGVHERRCWLGDHFPFCPGRGENPFTSSLTKFVQIEMKTWDVPGTSIAIIKEKKVFTKGFGFSTLPNVKVTPDTLFYAGSTTKAQTAACLSSMIQSGAYKSLMWSTKISSIIRDDFVVQDKWATQHLTLEDAVSHRSGLSRHDRSLQRDHYNGKPLSTQSIVRNMRNLPYLHEPRAQFIYGNYMFITLSHVIGRLTKKPLAQVMRETIWQPLGMRSTYFGLQDVKAHKVRSRQIAKGYTWNNNTKKHDQVAYMPLTDLSGAAAVISNARDYAKWIQGLLGETNLFSQDVHGDIRKGRMIHFPSASGGFDVSLYSLGWFRRTYNGRVYYWHDGSMIGFKCLVYWFPNDKFGFVIFANGDDAEPSNNNIAWKIIADRFQIPEKDVGVGHWPRVRTTEEQRVKDAVNLYYPNRSQDPPDLALDDIVGVYSNKGYGRMRVAAEIKKKSQGPIRTGNLVVERPEMTWHYGLRLKHVFGPNWIACESWIEDLDNPGQFHPAMFIKDARGKASALKIGWWANGAFEGNVTFTKIA